MLLHLFSRVKEYPAKKPRRYSSRLPRGYRGVCVPRVRAALPSTYPSAKASDQPCLSAKSLKSSLGGRFMFPPLWRPTREERAIFRPTGPPAGCRPPKANRGSAPRRGEHAAHVLYRRQRALQLLDVLDLEREEHRGDLVAGLGLDRDHVGFLPNQRLAHVAQQSRAIVAPHDDVNRIRSRLISPGGADDALRKALDHPREARAFAPVNGDAASLGDKT